jgi:hypothetical protein
MANKTKNKTITKLIEESMANSEDTETTVICTPKDSENRFKIAFRYNKQVVDLIKQFDGRYYESETHTWSLPNQYYDDFIKNLKLQVADVVLMPLKNSRKLKPEIQTATITKNLEEDIFTISSMSFNTRVIDGFKQTREKFYNPQKSEWSFPLGELKQIENILNNNNFEIKYN